MPSYYAITTHIRYYGQLPKRVWKAGAVVCGEIQFSTWGESAFTVDWRAFLETPSKSPLDLGRRKEPAHERLANMGLDIDSIYVFTRQWGFLNADQVEGHYETRPDQIRPFQDCLRKAWSGDSEALAQLGKDVEARIDVHGKGVDIAVVDLWNLIRLLFLRDHAMGKTKLCANKDCATPYFLAARKGQQYCNHKCAVLVNVRRFRERETKRKTQMQHDKQQKKRGAR